MTTCIACNADQTVKWYKGPLCRRCYRHKRQEYVAIPKHFFIKVCRQCGQEFTRYTYEQQSKNTMFCSRRCSEQSRRQHVNFINMCSTCGIEFMGNRKASYCSRACYFKKYKKAKSSLTLTEKIKHRLRSRLWQALRCRFKCGSTVKDLGCTIEQFKSYIESKFKPGMSWYNWSKTGWHLDHIKPLASFDLLDMRQFLEACHFTNLQPLWAKDNLKKGDK